MAQFWSGTGGNYNPRGNKIFSWFCEKARKGMGPFDPKAASGWVCLRNGREPNDLIWFSTFIWVNYNELTTSSLEIIVSKGNHPQMAQQFRWVNYYNLPRFMPLLWGYCGWLRNPAPVDRLFIPLFIGFQPSFWWCRISSIHCSTHHSGDYHSQRSLRWGLQLVAYPKLEIPAHEASGSRSHRLPKDLTMLSRETNWLADCAGGQKLRWSASSSLFGSIIPLIFPSIFSA